MEKRREGERKRGRGREGGERIQEKAVEIEI